jgi:membrane protease YdiL (CAAX protease family)
VSVVTLEQQSPEPGSDSLVVPAEPRPLGFWSSLGWLTLACVAGGLVCSVLVIVLWEPRARLDIRGFLDSSVFDYTYAVGALGVAPILAWAIRRANWRVWDYLALYRPRRDDVLRSVLYFSIFVALEVTVTSVLGIGQEDEQLMIDAYRAAKLAGTLPIFWLTLVVVAPIAEEVVFRGFLYRGWTHSSLGVMGTILVTSTLFGLLHIQYTWIGIVFCALSGVLFGWARWRSGTTTLPILLHVLFNLTSMTYIALHVALG